MREPMKDQQQGGERGTGTGSLGAGGEATVAINPTTGGQDGEEGRAGSEPLEREREHKGSYGGEGGAPRTSSDTREPINPS